MRRIVASGAFAFQQAQFGQLLLLPHSCQHGSYHSVIPAIHTSESCLDPLVRSVRPTASVRGGLVVAAAGAAVHSKGKKAKFSQQHPSKQDLKQQKLKQLQLQKQQQQQGQSKADSSQQQRDPSQTQPQGKQQGGQQQQPNKKKRRGNTRGKGSGKQQQMEQQTRLPQLQPQLLLTAQPPPRQQLELIKPATAAAATANEGGAGAESIATAVEVTAAAAAAIQAAGLLLPPEAASTAGTAAAEGTGQPSTPTGSNGSSSPKQSPSKLAGISYSLGESHKTGYKAAGVVVYDFIGPDMQPQLLLVREKTGAWNLPAGKISMAADGRRRPDATASRELEEETHGLIAAADSRAVLGSCPVFYCHSSKMAIYLMRYAGGEQLPELLEQRLAAGMKDPQAEGVDKLAWRTVDQIASGTMVYDTKHRSRSSANSSSKDPAAAAAAADDEEEGEDDVAADLASLQLQESSSVSTKQQQQPLEVRVPLYRNISRIGTWLDKLAKGQAPAPGLQAVHQQQQQQQQEGPHLSPPEVKQIQLPAKWADYAPSSSVLAAASAASSSNGSDGNSGGGQGFLSAGSSDGRAGTVGQQAASNGGLGSSSTGQQPWAIAVWSGQHAGQQRQEQ